MKLVLISDTHGLVKPELPDGDVLVHAGDLSMNGTRREVSESLAWLHTLRAKYRRVVLVAGNHDFWAESRPDEIAGVCQGFGLDYLNDSIVEIDGVRFWGSPVSPWFEDWAFGPHRGSEIRAHWELIPDDTDVLTTHGPPARVLDETAGGQCVGCQDLLDAVKRIKPELHVFGHIHEARGEMELPELRTRFVNASMLDQRYRPAGPAFTFVLGTRGDE